MLAEPAGRPAAGACDLTERRSAPGASDAIAGPTAVELVAALDRAWQDIRGRHEEVPPVVLLVGPSPSRPRARRRMLGYFAPVGWSGPQSDGRGGSPAPESPIAEADENEERYNELALRAEAILLGLAQLCREMSSTRGEVFIATEPVARDATDMFAVLLPWRRGRIQTLGMPSSDRASSRSACWNVGNPKGCQSDVGNLDGCPYRVISTGGDWMWNPNAPATATSTASTMNIISADGIEPAADFRRALGERKRGSALPLVVQRGSDVRPARPRSDSRMVPKQHLARCLPKRHEASVVACQDLADDDTSGPRPSRDSRRRSLACPLVREGRGPARAGRARAAEPDRLAKRASSPSEAVTARFVPARAPPARSKLSRGNDAASLG